MANIEHQTVIMGGGASWNEWRRNNPSVRPDLRGTDLSMKNYRRSAVGRALLTGGMGGGVRDLSGIDLSNADLTRVNLTGQQLKDANLSGADATGADLSHAHLINVSLRGAKLNGCRVFGISAWKVDLTGAEQEGLIITPEDEPTITVDNLEVAQFVYLLLNNAKIRGVIDTITTKAVLILGRFTPERKSVLDAIHRALRGKGYLPILFDFDKPASRDLTETVSTLALLSRFIVADITDPRSIPQELSHIVPHLVSVPVKPLLHDSAREYGMFEHFPHYPWVLEVSKYSDATDMGAFVEHTIIPPCEAKVLELRRATSKP
jgi:hypothetical protein